MAFLRQCLFELRKHQELDGDQLSLTGGAVSTGYTEPAAVQLSEKLQEEGMNLLDGVEDVPTVAFNIS